MKSDKILIGNTFPIAMIRRKVSIYPISIEGLRGIVLNTGKICSYWGHVNTIQAAQEILGIKFPTEDFRKPLKLSSEGYPMWGDEEFKKCYALSPNYRNGFRPSINMEVSLAEIVSWNALVLEWF